MSADHPFFNNFGYKESKRKITKHMPEEMQNNLFIMEIYNNWDVVKKVMKDYKEGKLAGKPLDAMDQNWINNLTQNNIDLETFSSADDFYEKFIK